MPKKIKIKEVHVRNPLNLSNLYSFHKDLDSFQKHLIKAINNDDFEFISMPDTDDYALYHPNHNGKVSFSVTNFMLHEMAHLVEIDKERYLLPDFGLGKTTFKNKSFNKNSIIRATAREERVVGIETVIRYGDKPNVMKNMSRVNRNETWQYLFNMHGYPNRKFQNIEQVKDWAFNIFQTATQTWSRDKIEYEFFKRVEVLRNNLHTKSKAA